ncbi:hypothetical protein R3P38DRAFT_2757619 [Favolaschia claudopus]|uniref:Uncharacterized protein n=1 Tax=Favolaschia claudopus TaxID=2862362 RepID=A0AAW0EI69_9AGAR
MTDPIIVLEGSAFGDEIRVSIFKWSEVAPPVANVPTFVLSSPHLLVAADDTLFARDTREVLVLGFGECWGGARPLYFQFFPPRLIIDPPASPQHDDASPMARFSPFSFSKAVPLIVATVVSLYLLPALINHIFGRPTPIALALVSFTDTLEHVFVALALINAGYAVWMTIYDMCSAMSSVDEDIPVLYPLPFEAAAQDLQPSPSDEPPLPLGVHGASLSKRFGSMVVTIPLFGLLIDKHRDESLNAPSEVSREAALEAVVSLRKGLAVLGGAMITVFVGGVLCILWDRYKLKMGGVGPGRGGDEGNSDVEDKLAMDSIHAGRTSPRPSSLAPARGTSTPSSSSKFASILLLIVLSLSIYLAPAFIDYIYGRPTPVAASFVWVAGLLDHGLAAFLVENAVHQARMILLERRISNPSPAPTPREPAVLDMAPDTTRSPPPLAKRLFILNGSLLIFISLAVKHTPTLLNAPPGDAALLVIDVLVFFLVGSFVVAGFVSGGFVGVVLGALRGRRGRGSGKLVDGEGEGGLDVEGVSVPRVVDDKARMSGPQEDVGGVGGEKR